MWRYIISFFKALVLPTQYIHHAVHGPQWQKSGSIGLFRRMSARWSSCLFPALQRCAVSPPASLSCCHFEASAIPFINIVNHFVSAGLLPFQTLQLKRSEDLWEKKKKNPKKLALRFDIQVFVTHGYCC